MDTTAPPFEFGCAEGAPLAVSAPGWVGRKRPTVRGRDGGWVGVVVVRKPQNQVNLRGGEGESGRGSRAPKRSVWIGWAAAVDWRALSACHRARVSKRCGTTWLLATLVTQCDDVLRSVHLPRISPLEGAPMAWGIAWFLQHETLLFTRSKLWCVRAPSNFLCHFREPFVA